MAAGNVAARKNHYHERRTDGQRRHGARVVLLHHREANGGATREKGADELHDVAYLLNDMRYSRERIDLDS